jgi:hypothetical protein
MMMGVAVMAVMAQMSERKSVLTSGTTAREELSQNPWLAGSNYLDYDRQLPDLNYTPAPEGYVPFYMSHYGRHGSRWLIGENDYERVIRPMRLARKEGKLTREGQETLRRLELFNKTTYKRLGDLTTVGERQHHGIGRRMAEHFPEIFKSPDVPIDARSTTVNRCILSMVAECEELMAANPTAHIHNDVSDALQYYLNQEREGKVKENAGKGDRVSREFNRNHTHPQRLMEVLFNDAKWVADSVNANRLMNQLFEVAINMQSHDDAPDLLHLFTADEIYDMWRIQNVGWYQNYGPSPYTNSIMPFSQANLLENIIQTADTCVALQKPQATLRFGHEVCVMPLACLLELDNCGAVVEDMEKLDEQWRNYRIFPMACNIQLIFYRPEKGKGQILMKALLNEREVSLPVDTDTYPYYRWRDVRKYWAQKLRRFKD